MTLIFAVFFSDEGTVLVNVAMSFQFKRAIQEKPFDLLPCAAFCSFAQIRRLFFNDVSFLVSSHHVVPPSVRDMGADAPPFLGYNPFQQIQGQPAASAASCLLFLSLLPSSLTRPLCEFRHTLIRCFVVAAWLDVLFLVLVGIVSYLPIDAIATLVMVASPRLFIQCASLSQKFGPAKGVRYASADVYFCC